MKMTEKKMLKSYEKENEKYLLDVWFLSKDEIKAFKHKELHKAVFEKLFEIAEAFKIFDFEYVEKYLGYSPSGDCMGTDKYYLSFEYLTGDKYKDDLNEIIEELTRLKKPWEEYEDYLK